MAEVFPLPPLVAYRRPPNLKDKLIRAKVPPPVNTRPKRELKGMKKCHNCDTCSIVKEAKVAKATPTREAKEANATPGHETHTTPSLD